VLAVFCVVVVAIPVLRSRRGRELVNPLEMVEELYRQRHLIYQELSSVKESFQMGNIPEGEYQAVSQNLKRRAAENLLLQRRWEQRLEALDQALEVQVRELRKGCRSDNEVTTCPECDATALASESNCPLCGTPLARRAGAVQGGGGGR
ncbi:MAG: hypothetical protein ACE5JL_17110, partial [Dehalococcoidia bacterium]